MKKRLSVIVALALTLSINATCFAAASTNTDSTAAVSTESSIVGNQTLSLEDVLGNIEKNNVEIQAKDQKILLYQRQYDRDKMNAELIKNSGASEVNYPAGQYANIKLQTDVVPKSDEQKIKDAEQDREDSLEDIKFTVQQQYFTALSSQDQIDTINAQIENVDKQIEQAKAQIEQGVVTNDVLESLNVQKSQLQASINTPKSQLQESLLNIKQTINMDLDSELTLVPVDKQYAKFDDSDIQNRIDQAVKNDYNIEKINNNIEILKIQEDIYKKYSHNDATGEVKTALSIQDLQNSLYDTQLNIKIGLWNGYYNLKNLEDAVTTANAKVASAQAAYDTAAAKVNQGALTQLKADSAALDLQSEKINLKNAQNNYMVAVEQFEYNLTK